MPLCSQGGKQEGKAKELYRGSLCLQADPKMTLYSPRVIFVTGSRTPSVSSMSPGHKLELFRTLVEKMAHQIGLWKVSGAGATLA